MTGIAVERGDDIRFIARVRRIAIALARRSPARDLIVVKIDNWFGPRWHEFGGKVLGALGVRPLPLRVPPFVPARVRWQRSYRCATLDRAPPRRPLHQWIDSESNLLRKFADTADGAIALWFSGETATNGRGAIMAYALERTEAFAWYAGWVKKDIWVPVHLRGISRAEVVALTATPAPSNRE